MLDGFTGEILTADSTDYETAATSFGTVGSPRLVVRPTTTDDVAKAVGYAKAEGLALSVRSGGHTPFSTNEGGIIVDLAGIRDIEVLGGGMVRIGSGAVWGDVAQALQPHGLALSSGDTFSVGVGGLTIGGGIGWMVRQNGLALDSLIEAEVVLASGSIVTANTSSEPELYWALRGGGGNFGVVTRFTFQAQPLPGVVAGSIQVDPGALAQNLRQWRDIMRASPEQLGSTFAAFPAFGPEMPPTSQLLVCYGDDDVDAAMAAIQPLIEMPGVIGHDIRPKAYADMLEDPPRPGRSITVVDNNTFADDFTDELIENLSAAHAEFGAAVLMIRYLRGALNRVATDATAFAHRGAEVLIISAAFLMPDADADATADAEAKIRSRWAELAVHTTGIYGNFTPRANAAVLELMFPSATADRLRAAKRHYDPENLFNQNQNIVP
ncbi:FAD-binding oxidoreductase [Glaciibacter superstes]|uniref:FAD-binding oxidoreductase n=1 Tax=Glaciibacter superstes TaxID=501023 RepID=UPI0003B5F320|nr:FAD-binding oxidoreductase [Glaciibacter superstes]